MPSAVDLSQFVFSGLTIGCTIALVALGFVLIANVTGVFNFAQGEYVMVGGMVTAWSVGRGLGWSLAVPLAAGVVAAVAATQERLTVAPVRGKTGPLALVVATLGVAVLLRGVALLVWGKDPLRAESFTPGTFELLGARLDNQALWVWSVTAVSMLGIVVLFRWTHTGRAMRASAIDPTAARLLGIRIGPLSVTAFVLAGALSGLVGAVTVPLTLVSWDSGITVGLTAFIAAAIGGFTSPIKAVVAGLALGIVEALAAGLISSNYRLAFVYGTLLVYLLLRDLFGEDGVVKRAGRGQVLQRRRLARRATASQLHAVRTDSGPEVEERGPVRWAKRRATWAELAFLAAAAALFPFVVTSPQGRDAAVLIVLAAIGATGLSLVMGLAGQLSLGQAAFYLVGGYSAAILTATYHWHPLPALAAAVAVSAIVAYAVGWLTLGLRGFNLAIATLAVQLMLLIFVTQEVGLTGGQLGMIGVPPFELFGIPLYDSLRFFYVALAVLVLCLVVARNLSRSRVGLALRALAADADGAEALGLRTARLKRTVFVVAGGMGGLAGALWAYYLRFADPSTWGLGLTIDLITFVIVGGLTSVFGGAVGAIVVGSLQYWIRESGLGGSSSQELEVILSGLLLILFVLVFRNGLVDSVRSGRIAAALRRFGRRRVPSPPEPIAAASAAEEPPSLLRSTPAREGNGARSAFATRPDAPPTLVATDLAKQFGGFAAVEGVEFDLQPATVTAMVGPNGAGKSTVINLLAGVLVPSEGRVMMRGVRIDGLPASEVARLGLARTFQTPKLFGTLTALETVMLARERYARSTLFGEVVGTPGSRGERRAARSAGRTWLEFVGLGSSADVVASSLPVGHQRLLDVARALASEPVVVLLDEPAAGLGHTETAALGELVSAIADTGTAVLLVEHDMRLVMSVADRVIVLDQGRKIADGLPSSVGQDEKVVEAYLGVAHV